MSAEAVTLGSRVRSAWQALMGAPQQDNAVELAMNGSSAPRRRGYPFRVTNSWGLLTGADLNTDFDGTAKYERYREMETRSAEIAGALALIDWPVLAATWSLEGGRDDIRDWLDGIVFSPPHPQALHWRAFLTHILKWRHYGCYLFEQIWTRDNDTGRVYIYNSPRPPDSVAHWDLDGIRIKGIEQEFQTDTSVLETAYIPGEKLLHFVYNGEANNVEGESILRACWPEYVSEREARDLRNIAMEIGNGVLKAKPRLDKNGQPIPLRNNEDDNAITTMRDFIGHHQAWLAESESTEIEFMQTVSDNIDKCQNVIEYGGRTYRSRILADFMNQGRRESGSRSTADTQEGPFWSAMWSDVYYLISVLQSRWIGPTARMNWGDLEPEDIPTLACTDLRSRNADEEIKPILEVIDRTKRVGPALERYMLSRAGVPEEALDELEKMGPPAPAQAPPPSGDTPPDGGNTDTSSPDKQDDEPDQANASIDLSHYVVDPLDARAARGRLAMQPVGVELAVDWETVARSWDDLEVRAGRLMDEFRARVTVNIMEQVRKELAANKPLADDAIRRIQQAGASNRFVDEYVRKLTAVSMDAFERGGEDVLDELRRMAQSPTTQSGRLLGGATRAFDPIEAKREVRQLARSLARSATTDLSAKLGIEAASEAVGQAGAAVPNQSAVLSRVNAFSRNTQTGAARAITSNGYGSGRHAQAIKAKAGWATYSTLLEDGQTCDACRPLHLRVFQVGSPEYFEFKPPYSQCFSTRSSSGRNRCRDIYIYTFDEPEAA